MNVSTLVSRRSPARNNLDSLRISVGGATWRCGVCGSINKPGEACPICSRRRS